MPLRGCGEEIGGFTLDIAAAHKTVRVRESERGLLGVSIHGRYYLYKVTPFWRRLLCAMVAAVSWVPDSGWSPPCVDQPCSHDICG